MSTDIKFYVMHDKNTGDVEFVGSGNRSRMKELMFKGYANIGSGLYRDVSELNRGICSNMRGMYEYQKRQNNELKVKLEEALQKLKEVHRISNTLSRVESREQHVIFGGKQYNSIDFLPLRERIEATKTPSVLGHLVKDFWEDVN